MTRPKGDPFRVKATILVDGDKVTVLKTEMATVKRSGWLLPTKRQFRAIGAALAAHLRA